MTYILLSLIVLVNLITTLLVIRSHRRVEEPTDEDISNNQVVMLARIKELENCIEVMKKDIPTSVLRSIQGSINNSNGKLGELVASLSLSKSYDRIIPLGKPVDFIGIDEDNIDFIEVKTGGGTLTRTEKQIQKLVEDGNIRFVIVRPDVDIVTGTS